VERTNAHAIFGRWRTIALTSPSENYRLIPLTQGQFALVDIEDYAIQAQWKWYAWWNQFTRSYYAVRNIRMPDGTRRKLWMHREILGLSFKSSARGDHKQSGQTLDNRRCNLRIADVFTNAQNSRPCRNKKYGSLKGAIWYARKKRWRAEINIWGTKNRGPFRESEQEAHDDYCDMATRHFGEFARLA
jgi:hypothetical protein